MLRDLEIFDVDFLPSRLSCMVQCRKGWYGIDCSLPSYLPPPEKRPAWIPRDAASNASDETNESSVPVTTMKMRPLVYVYDLPAEFSSQLLQVYTYLMPSFTCLILIIIRVY